MTSTPLILCQDPTPTDIPLAQQLHDAVFTRLGPAHAALFARPQPSPDTPSLTQWVTNGTTAIPAEALPPEARHALQAHAGSILADIRRIAQNEPGLIRTHLSRLRAFPEQNSLFAVDGRPVLTQWGQRPHTPTWLRHHDTFLPPQPTRILFPSPPALFRTALAASLIGLLAATALLSLFPLTSQCLLANNIARWKQHDPTVMSGCWQRSSNMGADSNDVLTRTDYTSWDVCIGPNGHDGTLKVQLEHSPPCTTKAQSRFDHDKTILTLQSCQLSHIVYLPRTLTCHQHDTTHIACTTHVDVPPSELPPGYHQEHEGLLEHVKTEIED